MGVVSALARASKAVMANKKLVAALAGGGVGVAGGLNIADRMARKDGGEAVVDMKTEAPVVLKFPDDAISAGNFWTKLNVYSWVPVKRDEQVPKLNHGLNRWLLANIWLPMPLTLATAYNQNYTETEDMVVDRGKGFSGDSFIEGIMNAVGTTTWQAAQEGAKLLNAAASMNNSAKMNLGSIMNQQMGLVYDGPSLRSHNLSWRMTPKDRKEQERIQQIVLALKGYASPAIKGVTGGDISFASSKAAYQAVSNAAKDLPTAGAATGTYSDDKGDSLRNIGRLAIPPTVSVEFWYGDKRNEHLFQIKDSFILSVEVNYTPTGTWNAYEDGAPIETQLTLNLKENAIVASHMVKQKGGY